MTLYQVVFCQGEYTRVDYETSICEQAVEIMNELQYQMHVAGERNFDYIIRRKEKRNG